MSQVATIAWVKLRMGVHAVASVRNESRLKVAVISISAIGLWLFVFGVFFEGFGWLARFGGTAGDFALTIGDVIMARMLSVLTLAVFFMLIFSNVLVAFSTLYRSREVAYLVQSPMSYRTLFVARFAECIVFSSWALAYLGSPMILAYGLVNGAGPAFYVASAAFYPPFVLLPAATGSLLTLVLARIFPRLRPKTLALLAAVVLGLFFVYVRIKLSADRLSEENFLPVLLDASAQTQSPFLPSFWTSRGILAAATGNLGECLFQFLLLLSNALMATWMAIEVASRLFYPGWSFLQGQDRKRLRPLGKGILGRLDSLLHRLPNPTRVLVIKDIKLFWRDPTQWSQFVIFFGIMAVYIANLRNARMYTENDFWRNWVACLNIGACTLILATLTSRFVFPLVSLEGRRFWVLGLAPISFRRIVWQKFWLSVATTSTFTVGLVVLSGIMLKLNSIYFILSVYSVCITNFGLAGLAVGLGTLYPNFHEENPARIVSGMGGTLNFVLSVAYVAVVVGAQTLVLNWRVLGLFQNPAAFWWALGGVLVLVTVVSGLGMIVPMRLGLRNLNNMEF